MRLIHISILFSTGRMSGVQTKLAEMARAARQANLPIDFYLINRERDGVDGDLNLVCADKRLGYGAGIKLRALKYYYLNKLVPIENYDAFVLRYHFSDPSMLRFMNNNKGKVFFEHHTKELNEIWKSGMKLPLIIFQYLLEISVAPYGLRKAKGVVAVTQEFLDHQIKRANLPVEMATLVLPNGALFSNRDVKLLPIAQVIRLVFVADRFRPWHGLTRLLTSLSAYQGEELVELLLVGQLSKEQIAEVISAESSNNNVHIEKLGTLNQKELLVLLAGCHIAIDSLATFELGMTESSTLKVKLYLEAGIPWISSAPDADVGSDTRLCYLVPNIHEEFAFELLINWRRQLDANQFATIVVQIREKIDWKVKLGTLSSWVIKSMRDRS